MTVEWKPHRELCSEPDCEQAVIDGVPRGAFVFPNGRYGWLYDVPESSRPLSRALDRDTARVAAVAALMERP